MFTFDVLIGDEFSRAVAAAKSEAARQQDVAEFEFNGITIRIAGDTDIHLIHRDWNRAWLRPSDNRPIVGPYPSRELTPQELAEDELLIANNLRTTQEREAAYEKKGT